MFKFLWRGKFEHIKRRSLIGDLNEGGLNMLCINSKLISIKFKFFVDFYKGHTSQEYHLGIQWLKFNIKDKLKNFNIIPTGDINCIPDFYKMVIQSVSYVKKIDKDKTLDFKLNTHLNLKTIYKFLKQQQFIKPKFEAQFLQFSDRWNKIYRNIHLKTISTKIKSFNYRFMYLALPTADRFNLKQQQCFVCKSEVETIKHIYLNCSVINGMLAMMFDGEFVHKFKNFDSLRFNIGLNGEEKTIFSKIKYTVWRIRDQFKYNHSLNSNIQTALSIYQTILASEEIIA
jgi:hypothetical protein